MMQWQLLQRGLCAIQRSVALSMTKKNLQSRPFQVRNNVYGSVRDYHIEKEIGEQSVAVETLTGPKLAEMIAIDHDLTVAKSKRILNTVFDTIVDVSIK